MVSKTLTKAEREKVSDLSREDLMEYFFDSYNLNVSQVCVYSIPDVETWREARVDFFFLH